MHISIILAALILCLCATAQAKLAETDVDYADGAAALRGVLVLDADTTGKRPAVLIFSDWRGVGEQARDTARRLAAMGLVAFAADMYGAGVYAKNGKEAAALAKPWRDDRSAMRRRTAAALAVLAARPEVDPGKIVAMGYCFGGTCALELARSGARLAGTASFHGGLGTPDPSAAKNITGAVVAYHGANDPNVPPAEVAAFEKEMTEAGVDWQLVAFGHAVHSFTNPDAGNDPSRGSAYNEKADKRSWVYFKDFLAEIVGLKLP